VTREELDDIVSTDPVKATRGYHMAILHLDRLADVDAATKANFERLGRGIASLSEWPEAERRRYRSLAVGIHRALGRISYGNDGWPLIS